MTTLHHTPHAFLAPLTSAEANRPLAELDAAIEQLVVQGSAFATSLTAQSNAGATSHQVASTAGLVVGDVVYLGTAGGTNESKAVATIPDATHFTTSAIANTYGVGSPVSRSPIELVQARGTSASLRARLDLLDKLTIRRRARREDTVDKGTNAVPAIVAHRGFLRAAPENTMGSFRMALAAGAKILETDITWSADGVPMIMHDSTIDRTVLTYGGNVSAYSFAELKKLDAGGRVHASWSGEGVPTLYDVLDEFGGRCTMIIEIKAGLGGEVHALSANRIADIIADYGLEDFTILASFNDLSAGVGGDAWSVHGIPLLRYTNSVLADGSISGATPAAHYAGGYRYVGLQWGTANFGPAANAWAAAGVRVGTFTILSRNERDQALTQSAGVTFIVANDPLYLAKPNSAALPVGQNIPFNAPVVPSGVIPLRYNGSGRGEMTPDVASGSLHVAVGTGSIGWTEYGAAAEHQILVLGSLGWGGSGLGKLSATMKLEAAAADLTRFGGVGVWTDDRGHTTNAGADTSTGYFGILRANGDLDLFRVDASGAETSLGTAAAADLVVGSSYVITLEVTATQVIFTANGQTITANDSTYRSLAAPSLHRNRAAVSYDAVSRVS